MSEPDPEILAAHALSDHHREALMTAGEGGCFFCCDHLWAHEVTEWTDKGQTAICPKCGIDAVLPGRQEPAFLERLNAYWFASHWSDRDT